MSAADIDPESQCRVPLVRREDLDADGQKAFDFYTSWTLRGLHGPAGIWLHSPKLAAREFNNAFEWAAHEREADHVGVPRDVIRLSNTGSRVPGSRRRSVPSSS